MATADTNFGAIRLPGIGELTAYSLGTASVFDANTPSSYFQDAMNKLGSFFQGGQAGGQIQRLPGDQGTLTTDKYGVVIATPPDGGFQGPPPPLYAILGGQASQVNQQTPTVTNPQITPTSPGVPHVPPPGVIPYEGAPGGPATPNTTGCDKYDLVCQLKAMDAGTRAILTVLGIVLIAVGIISLR